MQVGAGYGREVRRGFRFPHHLAARTHFDEAHALGSAQRVVIFALESVLAHEATQTDRGEPACRALGFGDFPDVADEVRHDPGIRIMALGLGLNEQSGNRDASLLERGDDAERRVPKYEGRLIGRTPRALQDLLDFGAVDVRDRRDARQREAQVRFGARQQRHCVSRDVLGHHVTVAIVDDAAGRGQRNRP